MKRYSVDFTLDKLGQIEADVKRVTTMASEFQADVSRIWEAVKPKPQPRRFHVTLRSGETVIVTAAFHNMTGDRWVIFCNGDEESVRLSDVVATFAASDVLVVGVDAK